MPRHDVEDRFDVIGYVWRSRFASTRCLVANPAFVRVGRRSAIRSATANHPTDGFGRFQAGLSLRAQQRVPLHAQPGLPDRHAQRVDARTAVGVAVR
jgi:hypothetical protein